MEGGDVNLNRVDSVLDSDLTSMSSTVSSIFSTEDFLSSSSSGDISISTSTSTSITSSSSGDFLDTVVVPRLLSQPSATELPTVVRNKCVGRNNKGMTWGNTSVIGRRKEMEDSFKVVPGFISQSCNHVGGCTAPGSRTSAVVSPVHFFGVYDGHGGSQVAKFCEEQMHKVLAEEWEKGTVNEFEWKKKWEDIVSRSFERTDNEVLTVGAAPEMIGSTAVVVVLSSCQIISSNCGDSRAVLVRGTETIPLTDDQKPDREDELERIEGQGGKVISWNGARVLGVLAMSRAIGDSYLRPWIIPVPEITFTTRSDDDECLILASDGLWDVMSNDEVGEVARRILRRRRRSMENSEISAAQVVADSLTEIALGKYTSDNISIIVVDLKSRKRPPPRR